MRPKVLVGVVVAVALVVGLAMMARRFGRAGKDTDGFPVAEVRRGELSQRVTVSGYVVPERRLDIVPAFDGYIRKLYVKLGDKVRAGDPLVKITPSAGEGDDAFPQRAGFDGTVVQVLRNEGEWVRGGGDDSVVLRVDDLSRLFVVSDAAELDVVRLSVGQAVAVKLAAFPEKQWQGVITEIARASNATDRWERGRVEFRLKAEIFGVDKSVMSGMSVTLEVITRSVKNALILDQEFVGRQGDDYYVLLPDGQRRAVKVGLRAEQSFEIVSGVNEKETVRQIDFLAM